MRLKPYWADIPPRRRTVYDSPLGRLVDALKADWWGLALRAGTTHSTLIRVARGGKPTRPIAAKIVGALNDVIRQRCEEVVVCEAETLFPQGFSNRQPIPPKSRVAC